VEQQYNLYKKTVPKYEIIGGNNWEKIAPIMGQQTCHKFDAFWGVFFIISFKNVYLHVRFIEVFTELDFVFKAV